MLFNIDNDSGARIEGWIMPDNPSATPKIRVVVGGETVVSLEAHVLRPLLRDQGLHATGVCGFVVDNRNCPSLQQASDLEIYDADTHVRIYRRHPSGPVTDTKLFRLETQLLRNAALNTELESRFHMVFTRLEMVPEETAKSMLAISFARSIYVTGRVPLRVFDPLLRDRGYVTCAYLRDPFEELAEQVLALALLRRLPEAQLRVALQERYLRLAGLIDMKETAEPEDYAAWLGGLSTVDRLPLVDPVTRLLTCLSPDDTLAPQAVADALDALAECVAMGFADETGTFTAHLGAALDCDLPPIATPKSAERVVRLARHLETTTVAREMLVADLELYEAAREAWRRAVRTPLDTLDSDDHQTRSRMVSR